MSPTFWLFLIVTAFNGANPTVLHIGNFSSLADCGHFAGLYTTPVLPKWVGQNGDVKITMICSYANQPGVSPPTGSGERAR